MTSASDRIPHFGEVWSWQKGPPLFIIAIFQRNADGSQIVIVMYPSGKTSVLYWHGSGIDAIHRQWERLSEETG